MKPEYIATQIELDRFLDMVSEVFFSFDLTKPQPFTITPSCFKLFGYTKQEFETQPDIYKKLIHVDDYEKLVDYHNATLRIGKDSFFVFRAIKKNGEMRWVEWRLVPTMDDKGNLQKCDGLCWDITDRENAKEKIIEAHKALQLSEDKFKKLFDSSLEGMGILTPDGKIIDANDSYCQSLGYTREEVLLMHRDDMLVNTEPGGHIAVRTREEKGSFFGQLKMRKKDGVIADFEVSSSRFDSAEGRQLVFICCRDITERLKAKRQLIDNEKRFRALIENGRDVITLMDAQGTIIYRSPSFKSVFGYTSEELTHKVQFQDVHPDDITMLKETLGSLMSKPGYSAEAIWRQQHKNGQWLWLKGRGTNLLHDPSVKAIVNNFRDVTEQKLAEEKIKLSQQRFKALIEKGSDAIAVLGLDKTLLYVSPSVERILGYKPDEAIGRLTAGFVHPDDLEVYRPKVYGLAANGDSLKVESRIRHKNGHWVWLEVIFTNQIKEPAVGGVVANFRDISERKKALEEIASFNQSLEKKVNERTTELQEANKLLESYNYSVAHDLKAPLRIIAGYAKVLSDTAKDRLHEQDMQLLNVIMNTSKKTAQLVSDLLAFSQVKQERVKPEDVNMDKLVNEVIDHVKETDTAPFAKLKLHTLGTAVCDSRLLKQVWVNLVSNAYKYSKQNAEPEVEIGFEITDGRKVYFIKDNGVGFNNEQAEKLFDVFYRVHRDKSFEGTGIGLALVKSVIDHHGGKIWAEGEEGERRYV